MANIKRRSGAASGTLLRVLLATALTIVVGCGGSDAGNNNSNPGVAGSSSAGAGGSGSGGDAGTGSSSGNAGAGGSAGSGGASGEGGSAGDGTGGAGGAGTAGNGGNGNSAGDCGEAGHGSTTEGEGWNCNTGGTSAGGAGTAGASGGGAAGTSAGSAGSSGTVAGSSGSSGAGTAGDAGAAGNGAGTGGSAAGEAGSSGSAGDAGSAGTAGDAGSSGNSASGGSSGSAGTAGTGAGAGGSAAGSGSAGEGGAGSGGSDAGSSGSSGSSGAGTAGSSGAGGSAGAGGAGGQVQNTFSCSGWTRDAALDAANTGPDTFFLVGGIWGTGANSVYVTLHNQNISSGMFHWDGTSWSKTVMPGNPPALGAIWGTDENNVYALGYNFKGLLFHKDGAGWSKVTGTPAGAKWFLDIWGMSSTDIWVTGINSQSKVAVWRFDGVGWQDQILPTLPANSAPTKIFGIQGHVFVSGYTLDQSANPVGGILLHFDGSSWQQLNVPAEVTEFSGLSGTSVGEIVVSGMTSSSGVVYRVTGLTNWSGSYFNGLAGMRSVWSKKPGTFLTGGGQNLSGSLRLITSDYQGDSLSPVDGIATNTIAMWPVAGSNGVMFGNGTTPGNPAGLYKGTCN